MQVTPDKEPKAEPKRWFQIKFNARVTQGGGKSLYLPNQKPQPPRETVISKEIFIFTEDGTFPNKYSILAQIMEELQSKEVVIVDVKEWNEKDMQEYLAVPEELKGVVNETKRADALGGK